jgi:hypothetical protein
MTTARVIPGHRAINQTHGGPRGMDRGWWTQERDGKLLYIIERYGDREKAARVLGVRLRVINSRLYALGKDRPL